jgi:hypothetical protein
LIFEPIHSWSNPKVRTQPKQGSNLVDDSLGTGVKDVDSSVVEIQVIHGSRKADLVEVCKHKIELCTLLHLSEEDDGQTFLTD